MLLNCRNGTIDLQTGELRPHDPEDLITKMIDLDFDPEATCALWAKFLHRVMDGDTELIEYLQRLCGYVLTGKITDQVFPVLYGVGANGKSVFVDTVGMILGEYATQAPESLITASFHQEHPTEIADLHGRRLVVATETEEGRKLRVGLVKKMTGDAKLKGRFMRRDFFEFDRTHKTVLITNNKPVIRETKHAIWRRLHLVPFAVTIPPEEQDHHLLAKLKAEATGILAWMVTGCLDWQRQGLAPPATVVAATEDYRQEQDPLAEFLEDTCLVGATRDNFTSRKAIRKAYADWCRDSAERNMLSPHGLYERLRDHPVITECWGEDDKCRRVRGFRPVRLIAPGGGSR